MVEEHHARTHHDGFRLERGGVSAVPASGETAGTVGTRGPARAMTAGGCGECGATGVREIGAYNRWVSVGNPHFQNLLTPALT